MLFSLHKNQIKQAVQWIKNQGFPIAGTNVISGVTNDIIDAIGFRDDCSVIIESKLSRSDFLTDKDKAQRVLEQCSIKTYYFYICPAGLIEPSEVILNGWGLLYSDGEKIVQEFKPKDAAWLKS